MKCIQQIREDYAPHCVSKPVSTQYQFQDSEVVQMHKEYMNSLSWMTDGVRDTYDQLRSTDPHGNGKGKSKGKELSPNAKAHNYKKQTFNVYLFQAFGSKQLFWHLVKGPDTHDINAQRNV